MQARSSFNTSVPRAAPRLPARTFESSSRAATHVFMLTLMLLAGFAFSALLYYWALRYQHVTATCIRNPSDANRKQMHSFDGFPTPSFGKPVTAATDDLANKSATFEAEISHLRSQLAETRRRNAKEVTELVDAVAYTMDHDSDSSNALVSKALALVNDETARATLRARLAPSQKLAAISQELSFTRIAAHGSNVFVGCQQSDGVFLEGLRTADFQVIDSMQRTWPHFIVHEQPGGISNSSVVVLVDRSLSMEGERINQLKSGLHRLIGEISNGTRMQIVAFDHRVQPITGFTNDAKVLRAAIDSIKPEGATAIAEAMSYALTQLASLDASKSVFLCTDGQDEKLRSQLSQVIADYLKAGVRVSVLAIDHAQLDKPTLQTLSEETFGCFAYAHTPDDITTRMEAIIQRNTPSYRIEIFAPSKPLSEFTIRLRNAPHKIIQLSK